MPIDTDSQSRKWQITLNNPVDKGYTHGWLKEILSSFKTLVYWCMSDEIGEEGTYHTHIYMVCKNCVRFSVIKKRFEGGHFEMARGNSQQNRDYVFKQGNWLKDKKAETNLAETHEEYGTVPLERPGARNDLADLYSMVEQGMTTAQIIRENPQYMLMIDKIDRTRQLIREELYSKENRMIKVTYVYGETGTGKTWDIMEKHKGDVCRITDYTFPFDSYKGENVIVFEEFRSSLPIGPMLNYLEIYPLNLPARYYQRVACYTQVYIVTNIPLEEQYINVQKDNKGTWKAFISRIDTIKHYTKQGIQEGSLSEMFWYTEDIPITRLTLQENKKSVIMLKKQEKEKEHSDSDISECSVSEALWLQEDIDSITSGESTVNVNVASKDDLPI